MCVGVSFTRLERAWWKVKEGKRRAIVFFFFFACGLVFAVVAVVKWALRISHDGLNSTVHAQFWRQETFLELSE